ncbi:MAG TPA: DUF5615 family PIN-like protein, partial [Dongiaceae bacterium]
LSLWGTSMSKEMRFLLDEDLNPAVAEIGRGLGLDVVSVHEIDRRGFPDEEQLRFAIGDGRTFLTRNRDDFLRLTVTFFEAGELHQGLLIVPYSLPNDRPELIAHALQRWADRPGDPGPHFVAFLSA